MRHKLIYLLAAAILLVVGCVSMSGPEPRSTFDRSTSTIECPEILVENLTYDKLAVYMGASRLGDVEGYQTRIFDICRFIGRNVELMVRPLAGRAFDIRYTGSQPLARTDDIHLQIGISPAHSWAVPIGQ